MDRPCPIIERKNKRRRCGIAGMLMVGLCLAQAQKWRRNAITTHLILPILDFLLPLLPPPVHIPTQLAVSHSFAYPVHERVFVLHDEERREEGQNRLERRLGESKLSIPVSE
jgi:hypothetical protein